MGLNILIVFMKLLSLTKWDSIPETCLWIILSPKCFCMFLSHSLKKYLNFTFPSSATQNTSTENSNTLSSTQFSRTSLMLQLSPQSCIFSDSTHDSRLPCAWNWPHVKICKRTPWPQFQTHSGSVCALLCCSSATFAVVAKFLNFFLNILPTILLTGKRKIIPLSLKINLDLLKNSLFHSQASTGWACLL